MKFIIGVFVIFTVVVLTVQGHNKVCQTKLKCDEKYNPLLSHNNCKCQVFRNSCELAAANAKYDPEFIELSKECFPMCTCYATTEWMKNPKSKQCKYTNIYCFAPVICKDDSTKPVTGSNGCECLIFRNRCDMERFNCAFSCNGNAFREIEGDKCNCTYDGPTGRPK